MPVATRSISFLKLLFLFVPVLYFLIAFLPFPIQGITTGLDPSWAYAISRAAADGRIFGKDIIFTFGPLGYLVGGSPLEQNLFLIIVFRLIVYLALFTTLIVKIFTLDSRFKKISLILSFLLAYLIGLSTDYQILFLFLLILSFDNLRKKSLRYWSLGLGIFAGLCLLTKFTLGIYTLGSLILFLIGHLYQSIKSHSDLTSNIFALINALLAAISVSFIFLNPVYYLPNFYKIILCFVISSIAGLSLWFFQKKRVNRSLYPSEYPSENEVFTTEKLLRNNPVIDIKFKSWSVFYIVYSLLLLTIIFHSFPSLIDYLTNSLEISSGYSSAMSFLLPYRRFGFVTLFLGISNVLLISILLILVAREKNLGFSLALSMSLFLAFKHGFVRQDGHIFAFAVVAIWIFSLCISKLRIIRKKKILYLLQFWIFVTVLIFYLFVNRISGQSVQIGQLGQSLAPKYVSGKIVSLLDLASVQSNIQKESTHNLAEVKLPENVANLVKNKTVDIIPWEISLVPANQLNWKPRPIFQSYSAYTNRLDNINFKSLSEEPRDFLFYQFQSIDGRHPFFDEPRSFAYVFCNYQPSSDIPNFIKTTQLSKIILLEKHKSSRCLSTTVGEKISIPWNISQSLEASDKAITRAEVKFEYTIFGKIYKAIFRAPPIMMQVNYANDSQKQYRIIPENSENGIIVSPLPRNDSEAMLFFRGQLPEKVKSFSFSASNSLLYKPNISIAYSQTKLSKQ